VIADLDSGFRRAGRVIWETGYRGNTGTISYLDQVSGEMLIYHMVGLPPGVGG